jgi:hypothetical protein
MNRRTETLSSSMSASLSVFSKEDAQNNPTFAVASTNKRKANDYQDRIDSF